MSDLKDPSYWVGHLIVILATVLGVYLAATAGYKQALKLHLLESDKGTYFLAESIYQELRYNNENMVGYLDSVKDKSLVFNEHIEGIKLNDFIFQAAKESESTFEIEPKLLNEVSNYYFVVGNALENYYESGKESPASLMKVVKEETENLSVLKTLVRLSEYNQTFARKLKDRGIPIGDG